LGSSAESLTGDSAETEAIVNDQNELFASLLVNVISL
jgi:hypothetical protein